MRYAYRYLFLNYMISVTARNDLPHLFIHLTEELTCANYFLFLAFYGRSLLFAQQPAEKYPVDSASVEHPGVPKGEILKFTFDQSKIFPGTWREYWVYVPAQYKPDKPACVYVNQDGIQWKAPTVFDNLIHKNEMPVTIGVFVTPGRVLADSGSNALASFQPQF